MAIPWHRFLKIGLNQLFSGTCFEVRDEFDLSDQKQLVDFVVLRRTDLNLPEPDPCRLPDGLQSLQDPPDDHNWLWELLRGDRSRWKTGRISDILKKINQLLMNMDVIDAEVEEFENQVLESWLEELSPEIRLKGLAPEERLKGLTAAELKHLAELLREQKTEEN